VIDRPVAENIIKADPELEIAGGIETEEQYGFVVQQGDEELLDELNQGLEEVIDSGEYETIYKKWFHKPVPPGIGSTTHEPS
jgi:ABC-type amino acid transport substrate-binding protein